MRSRPVIALLLAVGVHPPSAARSQSADDSTALARLAARLVANELPRQAARDSLARPVLVEPPQTRWDSAVANELRALRPDVFRPPADTLGALHIARARVTFTDTATYLTVRSNACQPDRLSLPDRPIFNAWTHLLRYEVERAEPPAPVEWRVIGSPTQTFVDGTCGPAVRPRPAAPAHHPDRKIDGANFGPAPPG